MTQKNIILFLFFSNFLFFCNAINAQNNRVWLVDRPPYPERDRTNLVINNIELTKNNTILTFTYNNMNGDAASMSICNTFAIMASGKKIATIQKTEGIPMIDVSKGFVCSSPQDMVVKQGQIKSYKLFFPPIPEDIVTIDLIEYNGSEPCEYDALLVDLRTKKHEKTTNARQQTPKNEEQTPKNEEQKTTTNPIVSIQKNSLTVKTKNVDIEIWDNDKEDGDIITLKLNGNIILENKEVKKQHFKTTLTLTNGENVLIMQAVSLGTKGKNTAAFMVNDGVSPPQTRVLNSDMGKSEAIKINVSN